MKARGFDRAQLNIMRVIALALAIVYVTTVKVRIRCKNNPGFYLNF